MVIQGDYGLTTLLLPLVGFFWIPAMMAASAIASKIAASRAASRQQQAGNNASQDTTKTSQYGINQQAMLQALSQAEQANMNRAGLDLSRRNFSLNAPTTRMSQAAKGSMLANTQDVQVSHPRAHIPTITGGARPSNLTPEARQLGEVIARKALMDQMAGDKFEDVPQQDWKGGVVTPPGVTPLPQPTGVDTVLNGIGLVGGALGAYQAGASGGSGAAGAAQNINQYIQPQQAPWTPQQLTPAGALPPWNGYYQPPR